MKKLVLLFACIFALQLTASANNDKPIKFEQLPQASQQFIKKHFANKEISIVVVESGIIEKNYDVIFANGDKVEFDGKGEWTNVDCEYSAVPVAVIPAAIKAYVDKHYPDAKVKQIEKDRREYDVELTNGWDIKFDKSFRVVELDK
jgi:hypothetical protein